MFTRWNSTSAAAIIVVAGLAAQPLSAQESDRIATLMTAYPVLAAIDDEDCLARLADYEAERGENALMPLVEGKVNVKQFTRTDDDPGPDRDFRKCLNAVQKAAKLALAKAPETGDAAAEAKLAEDGGQAEAKEVTADSDEDKGKKADSGERKGKGKAKAERHKDAAEEKATSEETAPDENAPKEKTSGDAKAEVAVEAPNQDPAKVETKAENGKPAEAESDEGRKVKEKGKRRKGRSDDTADDAAKSKGTGKAEKEMDNSAEAKQAKTDDAVQKDTKEATEAANETVKVEANVEADDAKENNAGTVETETITEETTRRSDEDFKSFRERRQARREARRERREDRGDSDTDDLTFGKVNEGVLGDVVLNEVVGANEQVVENTGDRIVIRRGLGDFYVLKDESALLRRPGVEVRTRRFDDGSVRETIIRQNGVRVVTVRAPNGQVVRRMRILPDGRRIVLFDDTARFEPINLDELPTEEPERVEISDDMDAATLRQRLAKTERQASMRRYSLRQIRDIRAVRNLVPLLQLESVNFETGSTAIRPSEAEELSRIGRAILTLIEENPYEVFLIEGHTDAVGSASSNLALSDRRAESVALALTEYFDVPPENMIVQGYGESSLRIPTDGPERLNRRAAVRRITPLLDGENLQ